MTTADSQNHPDLERLAARYPIVIQLFGPFQLLVAGQSVPNTSRTLQQALAFLVTRGNKGVFRAELAQALWPHASNERALFYLRRVLTQLRQAFANERNRLQSDDLGRVVLDLEGCLCDLTEFVRQSASHELHKLAEAVDWYQGSFLVGHDAYWVLHQRQLNLDKYVECQELVAAEASKVGELRLAASALQGILREDPLREACLRTLMSILAIQGDHAAASRAYQDYRRRLRREVGLAPSPETEALHRQLLSEFSISTPPPATDSGSESNSHALPYPVTPLFGRVTELATLLQAVKNRRAITIAGVGGVGKTRLALATAQEAEEKFTRVLGLNLRNTDQEDLLTTIAAAFGVTNTGGTESIQHVAQAIGSKRILLVLDNAESVAKRSGRIVLQLLSNCVGLTVLTTSRVPLQFSGEYVFRLEPLGMPELPRITAADALQSDAVQFFARRATEAKPTFEVNDSNATLVVELCRRLDCLPFALELAAVQLRQMNLRTILSRLEDHFDLKSEPDSEGGAPSSLETVMAWSYELLQPAERRLFENLAVFPGAWTDAEATRVADVGLEAGEDLIGILGKLVEQSLVSFSGDGDEGRYHYLDTVRSYALGRLNAQPEVSTAVKLRHALFCLEQTDFTGSVISSEENLRAAVANCLQIDTPEATDIAVKLVARRFAVWNRSFRLSEGLRLAEEVLAKVGDAQSDAIVELLFRTSGAAHTLYLMSRANSLIKQACAMADDLGLEAWAARSLLERGELAANEGFFAKAKGLLTLARNRYQAASDTYGAARCIASLGYVARESGDLVRARALTEEALTVFTQLQDDEWRLWCLGSLGAIHSAAGEYEEAEQRFLQTLAFQEQTQNHWAQAWNLTMLAQVRLLKKEFDASIDYVNRAIMIHEAEPENSSSIWALSVLGTALLEKGDIDQAEVTLERAITLKKGTDSASRAEVEIYQMLGRIQELRGNADQAAALRRIAETKAEQYEIAKATPLLKVARGRSGGSAATG